MALSSHEQNKVIQLLGYGGKILQPGSVIYNKILNDRLNQLPVDTESLIRSYLTQVSAIECQMNVAISRLSAKQVGDIQLNRDELADLRKERRKISRELAAHLDVPYQGVGGMGVSVSV